MELILWILVEIVYNERIPTVLIEGLERFAQEQKAMTSCQHHPPQPDPEPSATASYLPPPPPRPVIFSSSTSSSSSGCQPAAKKKKLNLQQMIYACN